MRWVSSAQKTEPHLTSGSELIPNKQYHDIAHTKHIEHTGIGPITGLALSAQIVQNAVLIEISSVFEVQRAARAYENKR